MTFRTPREAVELANNTVYGLAASVWSESINVSLHIAAQLKAGVVWVNGNESLRCRLRIRRISRERIWARGRP